ncbi:hypothetical protein LCGC14_0779530 [marine sediment metagenome]|uniref:OB domain-containing protein n=1 Tax=marine sediment metagenome TaxID=412755 RepID=A0A0F9Q073_9ZZZZ
MSNHYAKQRIVKEITNDDERIQVTGYIKNRIDNENIMLDDKTGEVKVKLIKIDDFNFKENDLINVIGDLELQSNGEKVINADIIQDMNKLNFEYYQKLYKLKKEFDK